MTTENSFSPNVFGTLKQIALENHKKLSGTFALVGVENLLLLLYPLVGGLAVNAVMNHNVWLALLYAVVVFAIWSVGSARRAVDTRVFVRIYADLAVNAVLNQKRKGSTSSATAHAALARQFVDFFEEHLPMLITAVFNIVGSVVMLLVIEFWSGLLALGILLGWAAALPHYMRMNDRLYFKLNNRLENEVAVIEYGESQRLVKHYRLLVMLSLRENVSAGHIYAVLTYLWSFAFSLDDMPRLVEKFSELKDIGKRVEV
ncbi:Integral membrane protein [Mannheimia varigena USDA-ARS-USMARC-1296]|uniref:Integral membrane protein n=1 Tax=Mannheimia varigena USDA-ARS-USMARC-1296 TaxID=1433287 RepID=W0QBB8_9PAST|nr:ABC transporter six-transmembrane domain-containing protein [Mannheimia varigena]AHG75587.1 Integral membrane protein [Mannheimia varigena USDA-ARS-USMARC-1296]